MENVNRGFLSQDYVTEISPVSRYLDAHWPDIECFYFCYYSRTTALYRIELWNAACKVNTIWLCNETCHVLGRVDMLNISKCNMVTIQAIKKKQCYLFCYFFSYLVYFVTSVAKWRIEKMLAGQMPTSGLYAPDDYLVKALNILLDD